MIRFFFPDPESPWTSEGYLGPSGITADSLKFAGQHIRAQYQDDATPKTVLQALEGAESWTEEQKERFWAQWRRHYHNRAGTDRGVPGIIPTGYELITIAAQSGADVVPLLEFFRDELLMDFGVSRSILGQVVSGDRSSAEVNQWVFDRYTVLPIANLIAEALTLQLAPDFAPDLFVEFEEFVSEDKRFLLEQETADLTGKVRSINQVREDRGLDPVPWGEEPVGQLGQIPYDPDGMYSLVPDSTDALGESPEDTEDEEPPAEQEPPRKRSNGGARPNPADFESKEAFFEACIPQVMAEGKTQEQAAGQCAGMWENRSRTRGYFSPDAEWERQLVRERLYVPSFERQMKAVLGIQERETIKRLKSVTPRARVSALDVFAADEWGSLFERRVERRSRRSCRRRSAASGSRSSR